MSCAGLAAMARTACEPLRRRPPGNPGPSRSACWPAAPWPGSCATCTAGPTRARCAITRCCGRCCASSAMARKAGALRHALGRHAPPDRLLQHPASRGRCRPPDPERSVGGRYRLLRTGPARGDGRERFDRAAAQPSAPAFRLLRDVGRRLRVAPPRPGRRRAGARPAAVRHAGGATRDRAAVFSGRHSLPHRGLRRSAPARVPAPRAAGTIGEDAARRPGSGVVRRPCADPSAGFQPGSGPRALRRRHGGL